MKKLLVLLFSLLFLSSTSVIADDISDFSIEGISIGDSLLDYMSEEEILKEIELRKGWYSHLKKQNKYAEVYLEIESENYDYLAFLVKNNSSNTYISNKNEKYIILSVRGDKLYINDFDSCIQKRDEIVEVLSPMFINAHKSQSIQSHTSDPSGNSDTDMVAFEFDEGHIIKVYCSDFEENFRISKNWDEGLLVIINTEEIESWLSDY